MIKTLRLSILRCHLFLAQDKTKKSFLLRMQHLMMDFSWCRLEAMLAIGKKQQSLTFWMPWQTDLQTVMLLEHAL